MMNIVEILQNNNCLFLTMICLISLIVGSFLNVVIYRLPVILKNTNKQAALEIMGHAVKVSKPFSLSYPKSHCPHCHTSLPLWNNIPLLSYMFLRGQSGCCQNKISSQYPIVEALSAVLSLLLAWRLGPTLLLVASLLLIYSLIILSFIDVKTLLLPDQITLPVLWLGLFVNTFSLFTTPQAAILGAAAGYLFFYLIAIIALKIRKVQSLGNGDLKLIALLGAWFGWQLLPILLFISSVIGSVIGMIYLINKKEGISTQLPFGPFLSLGAFIVLLLNVR
jgi:leader peptidase (prepilin peptidase)/N-methyltransferase